MTNMLPPEDAITLLDADDDIDAMARDIFAVWGDYNPGETLDVCRADLTHGLDPRVSVPKTFVYRRGGEIAGWISIIAVDIEERPDLGPWLANLIVRPAFRNQGIARHLVRHLMAYAAGVTETLYLYTDNLQASYEKLGWKTLGPVHVGEKPVVLMTWDTSRSID